MVQGYTNKSIIYSFTSESKFYREEMAGEGYKEMRDYNFSR